LPKVLGDSNQLTQVFLNLIVNAEQAIREVRDHGTIRIRLGVISDRVVITFMDDAWAFGAKPSHESSIRSSPPNAPGAAQGSA